MYQFKYQTTNPYDFYTPIELIFTCIVPVDWLSKDLPTIGDCVNYANKREQLVSCGPVVFEFSDVPLSDKTFRAISLDILHEGMKCFEKPVLIYCPNILQTKLGDECSIEVVLLNHLFGYNSPSAWVAVDFDDFITTLKRSSTFYFKYGVGRTLSDILPGILDHTADRDVKCEILMIFCDHQNMKLEYISEAMAAINSSSTDECMGLICAMGVEQEQILISVLVGR